jgi:membrane protein
MGRALNVIFRVEEGRGFVRKKANALLWTLILSALGIVTFLLIFLGGGLASGVLVEVRRFRWITPGAVTGVLLWILASAGFFVYVSNFSSYSATYGAFAAVVILLVWLRLSNVVLLFGAELNAVVDLRRSPNLPENYDGPVLPAKEPAKAWHR